ncbi:hypothetical protein Fcan01_26714 [Folsomia candida]|uniref:Uncharacterized protein n=1 Tax=Folsomia candida TaxID=158441 RepID=A0A226D119_FOLCA|nr:hypothetical protein Fcan01_26714 [Folsomia candida]
MQINESIGEFTSSSRNFSNFTHFHRVHIEKKRAKGRKLVANCGAGFGGKIFLLLRNKSRLSPKFEPLPEIEILLEEELPSRRWRSGGQPDISRRTESACRRK